MPVKSEYSLKGRLPKAHIRSELAIYSPASLESEYIINLQAENYAEFSFSGVVRNDTDDLVATTIYLAANGLALTGCSHHWSSSPRKSRRCMPGGN